MQKTEEKYIEANTAMTMLTAALAVDGAQALLTPTGVGVLINPALGVGAGLFFNSWFNRYGIRLMSRQNAGFFAGTFLFEMLPIINTLPLWTGSVILTLARNHKRIRRGRTLQTFGSGE